MASQVKKIKYLLDDDLTYLGRDLPPPIPAIYDMVIVELVIKCEYFYMPIFIIPIYMF